jgi:hypothetical protein
MAAVSLYESLTGKSYDTRAVIDYALTHTYYDHADKAYEPIYDPNQGTWLEAEQVLLKNLFGISSHAYANVNYAGVEGAAKSLVDLNNLFNSGKQIIVAIDSDDINWSTGKATSGAYDKTITGGHYVVFDGLDAAGNVKVTNGWWSTHDNGTTSTGGVTTVSASAFLAAWGEYNRWSLVTA